MSQHTQDHGEWVAIENERRCNAYHANAFTALYRNEPSTVTPFPPMPTHPQFINLVGRRYGRLTVVSYAGKGGKVQMWLCKCECGGVRRVNGARLKAGQTQSCGCLRLDRCRQANTKHGESGRGNVTPEYSAYHSAQDRCVNPANDHYKDYGERGIEFRFASFDEFIEHIGRRPSKRHSLNRIDNDGHYEKGNVHWATDTQQQRNRRNNRILIINEGAFTVAECAEIVGTHFTLIHNRLSRGWCDHCAVYLKSGERCSHRQSERSVRGIYETSRKSTETIPVNVRDSRPKRVRAAKKAVAAVGSVSRY